MSQEVRVKKKLNIVGRSLLETFGIIAVLILLILGYTRLPNGKSSVFSNDYNYLDLSGQLLLADTSQFSTSQFEKVTVTSIIDGDTIKVKRADNSEATVRYIGIDTPQVTQQGASTNQPYGVAAAAMNSWLVLNKTVYLQRDTQDVDKQGYLLRYVYLDSGAMVNYVLIRLGYANIMTLPPNVAFQQQLFAGQELAKKEGRNLFTPSN